MSKMTIAKGEHDTIQRKRRPIKTLIGWLVLFCLGGYFFQVLHYSGYRGSPSHLSQFLKPSLKRRQRTQAKTHLLWKLCSLKNLGLKRQAQKPSSFYPLESSFFALCFSSSSGGSIHTHQTPVSTPEGLSLDLPSRE